MVDPEGDYTNLEFATVLGNHQQPPRPEDVAEALKNPARSIVVNLLGVPLADRPAFFAQLLPRVLEEKARTGRPHWLVVDEAHHMLPQGPDAVNLARQLPDRGTLYITVHAGAMDPTALEHVGTLLVIGGHPAKTVAEFCKATREGNLKCPDRSRRQAADRRRDALAPRRGARDDHPHQAAADRAQAALAEVRRREPGAGPKLLLPRPGG